MSGEEETLRGGLAQLQIELSGKQIDQLLEYLKLL